MSITPLPECGVARFLTLLEGPWATLIVRELLHGPHRFTELRTALPRISPHTLTSRLRQFEAYGLVTRTAYPEIPPRVEYRLTPLGEGLGPVLQTMAAWATSIPDPTSPSDSDSDARGTPGSAPRAGGSVGIPDAVGEL
ncbi:winged helix-turn-helix transcriptional regulator [Kitasatospora sp. NBC_00458]|uniref:winged helix-turn-helix transcriptional regulator n=1 Tax=Kitasatospora sp. NBC_00458 TaxID=2903568 RepID=UPI002E1913F5